MLNNYDAIDVWFVILVLSIGTFALRYSFLGLAGKRSLPTWALKYLRYTAVGILPAMATPLVVWPHATMGITDPIRLLAAAVTLATGAWTRSVIWSIVAGFASLYLGLWMAG